MNLIVFNGSDAGYGVFVNGHWVHHGGWGIDSLSDVSRGMAILGQAARLKTPGLSDVASKAVADFVQKELTTHLGDQMKGGAVIINVIA